jgi:signal transduction histidine kinase
LDGKPYTLEETPLARALRSNETTSGVEMLLRRAGGADVTLRVSTTPIHDTEGKPAAAVIVFDDVTADKQAEAERLRVAGFQERSVDILGHDLRNPLSAIMLSASALNREQLPELHAKHVRRILSSSERMARMMEQLLNYTRSRLGGGIPIEQRETDLAEVSQRIVDELSVANSDRRFAVDGSGKLNGEWDGDRLGAVISNLVSNAIHYGRPGGPIEVRLIDAGCDVMLEVHNDGDPIPADVVPTIFEPFRRGTTSRSRQGLGLGLFIAQEIVRAHRGTLDVRSSAQEGTTFTMRLPRRPASSLAT